MNYRLIALILLASALITQPPAHAQDNTPIDYAELTWSPDGTHLAYSSQEDIWVYDFATGEQHNLTGDVEGLGGSPVWSPDSTRIAFLSTRGVPQPSNVIQLNNLWLINLDGTDPINLTNTTDYSYSLGGFSTNGTDLLMGATLTDIQASHFETSIALLNINDLSLKIIAPSKGLGYGNPSFSPDGQHILFQSFDDTDISIRLLWVINYLDDQATPPVVVIRENGSISQISWSPDGCCVAYSVLTAKDIRLVIKAVDIVTGATTLLGEGLEGIQTNPFWSPDGSKIAFFQHDFNYTQGFEGEIWLVNRDGSNPTMISTPIVGNKRFGIWSPDGTQMAFVNDTYDGGGNYVGSDIWLINADGSNPQNLTGNFQ